MAGLARNARLSPAIANCAIFQALKKGRHFRKLWENESQCLSLTRTRSLSEKLRLLLALL
jgi:hypothetical protein